MPTSFSEFLMVFTYSSELKLVMCSAELQHGPTTYLGRGPKRMTREPRAARRIGMASSNSCLIWWPEATCRSPTMWYLPLDLTGSTVLSPLVEGVVE